MVCAQVIAGQVAGDLAQPGQEAGGVLQAVQLLPGLEEGFLGNVFADRYVAGDGQGNGGHRVLAGAHDSAIGVLVTACGGGQFALQHQVQGFGIHGRVRCRVITTKT